MNSSPSPANAGDSTTGRVWPWFALAVLVCLLAISRQSLWTDETLTAVKAMQPSLNGWWHAMTAEKASDLQMPLYMIYMWGFVKIFGAGEWALRAANIPWFVAGFVAVMKALPEKKRISFAVVALLSSFAWYYIGEARPYAMQLGASLMIVAALYRLSQDKEGEGTRTWVVLFFVGVIALSGSSLLGMIWAGAACLSVLVLLPWNRTAKIARANPIACVVSIGLLAVLACYYLWTLKVGARASGVGRTDARNLVFITYELLGFGGLGPGRLEIRDQGLLAFVPFVKSLVVYGVLVCDLLILGGWQLYRGMSGRKLAGLIIIAALPVAVIWGAGYVKEFRVLGRHFTPLMGLILFVLCLGLRARWSRPHWASKPLAVAFVVLSLASSLSYRLAPRHARDDYRDAAAIANAVLQTGRGVWWNAAREGAVYYRVPLENKPDKGEGAVLLMNPTPDMIIHLPPPEFIITSKPDVYDAFGAIAHYLKGGGYSKVAIKPAFVIWRRKDSEKAPSHPQMVRLKVVLPQPEAVAKLQTFTETC